MPINSQAARVVAKLLAKRRTSITEIPHLIESVERALFSLNGNLAPSDAASAETKSVDDPHSIAVAAPIPPQRRKRTAAPRPSVRRTAQAEAESAQGEAESAQSEAPSEPLTPPVEIKPVQPTLVRRAEIIHVEPTRAAVQPVAPAHSTVRGVVQWFDTRTGRGTLRLQGLSNDLPVEGETLAAFGLTRLFKGQEIEAQLDGEDETPKLTGLRLLNHGPAAPISGGVVRDRHAKQVVVELKRQAHSRVAARAEAELLLSRRAR